jgi:nicotinate-nucleotide--dimethylbenzimidazole phosphoribosyltransferase
MSDSSEATASPLEVAIDGIDYPDGEAARAAEARQRELATPGRSFGRLDELAIWIASVQGECPPHDFSRARVLIFAGDHGIATAGVSARPEQPTARILNHLLTGAGAVNAFADLAGASVRLADIAVDDDTDPVISDFKIRKSSGTIDQEDALIIDEAERAISAGIALADAEIDAGADLLIVGDLGLGNTTVASTLISILTDSEPVQVVGWASEAGDADWMARCAAIRDARRRGWPHRYDTTELLRTVGGADIAAMVGFIAQSAARRTPVLLDSVVSVAAALIVQRRTARVVRWLRAGQLSPEPAHAIALEQLGLDPILDLQMSLGQGTGALIAVPVLRAATRTLAP